MTSFSDVPGVRVPIAYQVHRVGETALLVSGQVTLCFFDPERAHPIAAPEHVRTLFERALQTPTLS